jgi:hypothetical protein
MFVKNLRKLKWSLIDAKALLEALKGIADFGDDIFVDVITEVCTLSKVCSSL